jgi:hypothetical protein
MNGGCAVLIPPSAAASLPRVIELHAFHLSTYRPEKAGFSKEFLESELKQMNCFTDFSLRE